jgi:transposase InsO family protein
MKVIVLDMAPGLRKSQRRICKALEIARSSLRYKSQAKEEVFLEERILYWAKKEIKAGYRQITGLLKGEGLTVNHKKVERIWSELGLKLRKKKKKYRHMVGEVVRIRPERKNQVWSYDMVSWKLFRGGKIRILNVIDEYSRECLGVLVKRSIKASDVEGFLAKLFIERGRPEHLRSDNGSEFTARTLMSWLSKLNVWSIFIDPGSPWQNGYCESFNGKMRYECLDINVCSTVLEAEFVIKEWVRYYNTIRPHSSLGYRPPAPEAIMPRIFSRGDLCFSLN